MGIQIDHLILLLPSFHNQMYIYLELMLRWVVMYVFYHLLMHQPNVILKYYFLIAKFTEILISLIKKEGIH